MSTVLFGRGKSFFFFRGYGMMVPRTRNGGTVFFVPLLLLNQVLTFLGLIGVIVDPTTAGLGDSDRALGYVEPWDDNRE